MRGAGKPEVLLVPTKVDRRTGAGREIEAVLSDFREPVAPAVSLRAAHVDAFGAGRWIGEYAPRSAGHVEALQQAALRRAARRRRADTSGKGRGGRPSVSEIVVDLLTRHRKELDGMD